MTSSHILSKPTYRASRYLDLEGISSTQFLQNVKVREKTKSRENEFHFCDAAHDRPGNPKPVSVRSTRKKNIKTRGSGLKNLTSRFVVFISNANTFSRALSTANISLSQEILYLRLLLLLFWRKLFSCCWLKNRKS